MVNYVKVMTTRKSCKSGKYGSFARLVFSQFCGFLFLKICQNVDISQHEKVLYHLSLESYILLEFFIFIHTNKDDVPSTNMLALVEKDMFVFTM